MYTPMSGVYYLLYMCHVYADVWCVLSATHVSCIRRCLVCTICYTCLMYTPMSGVYHLLHMSHVYADVWCVSLLLMCYVYAEIWCVPSATHVSCIRRSQIKFSVPHLLFATPVFNERQILIFTLCVKKQCVTQTCFRELMFKSANSFS